MSWLYSRALVEAFSEATCSAGEPSAPLSGNPTPQAYLPSDRTTAFSRLSRFGMTFAPLTEVLGADVLTWFLAGFPVRTYPSQGRALASTESAPACGATWRELWAKYDPDSCSWRTLQPSLLGDSDESSPTWPRSGMTAGGLCWALPMSERRTSEIDYGYLLPTPCTVDSGSYFNKSNSPGAALRPTLGAMAKFNLWPTATTPAGHAVGRLDEWGGARSREVMRTLVTPEELGGPLNPTWVEWFMGWPLGWTDLRPLAMDKSRSAPQPRGESLLVA